MDGKQLSKNIPELEAFRSGLSPADQAILEDLLERASQHEAAIRHTAPEGRAREVTLLVMLMEQRKLLKKLRRMLEGD